MSGADAPFDPGLQPERTSLSWQRTTLALGVAFLVTARLLAHESSPLALAIGGVGIAITIAILSVGHRRYVTAHTALTGAAGEQARFHTAWPLLVWAALTAVLALVGVGAVVVLALRR